MVNKEDWVSHLEVTHVSFFIILYVSFLLVFLHMLDHESEGLVLLYQHVFYGVFLTVVDSTWFQ